MNDQQFTPAPEFQPMQPAPQMQAGSQRNIMLIVSIVLLVVAGVIFALALRQPGKPAPAVTQKDDTTQVEQVDTTGAAAGKVAQIDIDGAGYTPDTLTIEPGTTVAWTNKDSKTHTLNGDEIGQNNAVEAGATFTYTFDQPGDFAFTDGPVQGTISVRE